MPNIYSELYSYLYIYIIASPCTRPHSKSSKFEASRYSRVHRSYARAPSDRDVTHSNDANSVSGLAVHLRSPNDSQSCNDFTWRQEFSARQ